MNNTTPASPSRREFIKTSAAASVGGVLAAQFGAVPTVHAAGSDTLKIGLIGCGGRGTSAAQQALAADKNIQMTAIGDVFDDRLQTSLASIREKNPDKVKVTPDTTFIGFDAYQKVIDSGVDVVILTTPPGFRPMHLKAAIAAGKHVFAEKPVAVDAPGYRSVLETVEEARKKNLAIVSGFCWRYSSPELATFQQIHDGRIGDISTMYGTYNTGSLWSKPRKPEWSDMEWQIRNWLYFTWLSGDHIVEQAVHTIDKIAWTMKDASPVRAVAHGGRQTRTDPAYGHIFDHFSVVYEFAKGERGFLFCRQQEGCATEVADRIWGTKGMAHLVGFSDTHYIKGENSWKYDGPNNNMYQTEHDELFASIRNGKPINNGVRMANSTMMAIMGRMAAYTGQTVTWEQAINSKETSMPEKLEWGPLPVPPVAMPGHTKLV
jgi:predicted dehydrogenase